MAGAVSMVMGRAQGEGHVGEEQKLGVTSETIPAAVEQLGVGIWTWGEKSRLQVWTSESCTF